MSHFLLGDLEEHLECNEADPGVWIGLAALFANAAQQVPRCGRRLDAPRIRFVLVDLNAKDEVDVIFENAFCFVVEGLAEVHGLDADLAQILAERWARHCLSGAHEVAQVGDHFSMGLANNTKSLFVLFKPFWGKPEVGTGLDTHIFGACVEALREIHCLSTQNRKVVL